MKNSFKNTPIKLKNLENPFPIMTNKEPKSTSSSVLGWFVAIVFLVFRIRLLKICSIILFVIA